MLLEEPYLQEVEAFGREVVASHGVAGLAIGIVSGERVYARGFGVRSLATGESVTEDSLFHLASVSKTFVSAAVMQLAEVGLVDLDAPLASALPDFRLADERYPEITIRQMLNHTSGMPDTEDFGWDRPEYGDGALERYVRSLSGERLVAAPGEGFAYSNIAYEALGLLVSRLSGETFESYVKKHLLDPLGMESSTFLKAEVSLGLATAPHIRLPALALSPEYPYHRAHAPSSTLHSSAREMCNWARLHLNRGYFEGRRLLQPSSYAQLWYPYAPTGGSRVDEFAGLGWFVDRRNEHTMISHDGEDVGFQSDLVLLPEPGVAVVVLANTLPAPVNRISQAILDLLLGKAAERLKPPAVQAVAGILAKQGVAEAAAGFRRLQSAEPERYDFGPEPFVYLAGALLELGRRVEAGALLRMGMELHPEHAELAVMLAKLPEI